MSTEPLDRIRAIGDEIAAVAADRKAEIKRLQEERAAIVEQLRDSGWSIGRLADELGVSRTRIQQFQDGQPSNAERLRRRRKRETAEARPAEE